MTPPAAKAVSGNPCRERLWPGLVVKRLVSFKLRKKRSRLNAREAELGVISADNDIGNEMTTRDKAYCVIHSLHARLDAQFLKMLESKHSLNIELVGI